MFVFRPTGDQLVFLLLLHYFSGVVLFDTPGIFKCLNSLFLLSSFLIHYRFRFFIAFIGD